MTTYSVLVGRIREALSDLERVILRLHLQPAPASVERIDGEPLHVLRAAGC